MNQLGLKMVLCLLSVSHRHGTHGSASKNLIFPYEPEGIVQSDYFLDLTGTLSAIGLLKISRTFQDLEPGQTLVVQSDVQSMRDDTLRILETAQIRKVWIEELGHVFRLYIVKKEGPRDGSQTVKCGCDL
jgi:TusA-related sulfurtransferase